MLIRRLAANREHDPTFQVGLWGYRDDCRDNRTGQRVDCARQVIRAVHGIDPESQAEIAETAPPREALKRSNWLPVHMRERVLHGPARNLHHAVQRPVHFQDQEYRPADGKRADKEC
jgi:hypothetical protein